MMGHRDGAVLQLIADDDLRGVLEYMQNSVPTQKLIGIAESLPQMARLLWTVYPQEPVAAVSLQAELPSLSTSCEKQPVAI
jgi:hypothetical protein